MISIPVKRRLFITLLIGFSTLSQTALSATTEKWYEISVVVFKHKSSSQGNEKWEAYDRDDLQFPENNIILDAEEPESESEPENTLNNPPDTKSLNSAIQANVDHAFKTIEPTDKKFKKTLANINYSPSYTVMFNKTWLQPATSRDKATAIIIQAGKEYGDYYELEGSVTLSVARYLHLKADLWLADYEQQVDVLPSWESDLALDDKSDGNQKFLTNKYGLETNDSVSMEDNSVQVDLNTDYTTRYKTTRLARMEESRRMRSGELHYLDHPLFGIVVKVIPHKLESNDNKEPTL